MTLFSGVKSLHWFLNLIYVNFLKVLMWIYLISSLDFPLMILKRLRPSHSVTWLRWPTFCFVSGMSDLGAKWVRLAPNGTNPGLFQIRFQYIFSLWDQTWHPYFVFMKPTALIMDEEKTFFFKEKCYVFFPLRHPL